jgi:hypothetical protein
MSEDSDDALDIGTCPVCDRPMALTSLHGMFLSALRWICGLSMVYRAETVKAVASNVTCALDAPEDEDSLADALMAAAVIARERAENKRAFRMALKEQDDAKV